jgi:predicted house-cleaning noncanonical NTP pyrophosphatase (MazG superfamily)
MNIQFLTPTKMINVTSEFSDAHKNTLKEEIMDEITEKVMEKLQDTVESTRRMPSRSIKIPQIKNLRRYTNK